jgi:hypothetical protein
MNLSPESCLGMPFVFILRNEHKLFPMKVIKMRRVSQNDEMKSNVINGCPVQVLKSQFIANNNKAVFRIIWSQRA